MRQILHPSRETLQLEQVLRALADSTRLHIVRRLAAEGAKGWHELSYPVAKSTLSHHVKVLREAGLLFVEVRQTRRRVGLRYDDIHTRWPGLLESVGAGAPAGRAPRAGAVPARKPSRRPADPAQVRVSSIRYCPYPDPEEADISLPSRFSRSVSMNPMR
ncbi:hypothetical protein AB0M29_35140 [Streptomyces sp. NPDC051976]|uniref:ArsR/SmtB family transcription factor n=1 Tax=Streptomyces sp. NPDC051976 TaxID=3154947 RepID=UPI003435F3BC